MLPLTHELGLMKLELIKEDLTSSIEVIAKADREILPENIEKLTTFLRKGLQLAGMNVVIEEQKSNHMYPSWFIRDEHPENTAPLSRGLLHEANRIVSELKEKVDKDFRPLSDILDEIIFNYNKELAIKGMADTAGATREIKSQREALTEAIRPVIRLFARRRAEGGSVMLNMEDAIDSVAAALDAMLQTKEVLHPGRIKDGIQQQLNAKLPKLDLTAPQNPKAQTEAQQRQSAAITYLAGEILEATQDILLPGRKR